MLSREVLESGELRARGFLDNASNHTLLVQVGDLAHDGGFAVYKPRRGERPLWDFPAGSLCQREVAASLVSDALGWALVPPTVLRDGPLGIGSLQVFVPHDPERHYFVLVDEPECHDDLARIALFDLLINNADRKGSHVLAPDDGDGLVAIDHGVAFHVEPKLRTVVWELGGRAIPATQRDDLRRVADELARDGDLHGALGDLLASGELAVLAERAAILSSLEHLPAVDPDRRPYPWPPL